MANSIFTSTINHKYKIPCFLISLSQLQCTLQLYGIFFMFMNHKYMHCQWNGFCGVIYNMVDVYKMRNELSSHQSVHECKWGCAYILLCWKRFISVHSQKPIREQRECRIPEEYLITQRMLRKSVIMSFQTCTTYFLLWNIKHDILNCSHQTLTFIIQTKSFPLKVFNY